MRVHTCGICGTDLKKIATGSHSAPRIFGHETAGVVVASRRGRNRAFAMGDRVMVFHHIPCGDVLLLPAQGVRTVPDVQESRRTAGYEPSGGGFAEYVRVMDWIVDAGGVVRIPDGVSFRAGLVHRAGQYLLKGIETLGA